MARKIRFRRQQSLGRKVGNSLAGSRAMTWMIGFKAERELEPGGRCERGPIMRSTCRSLKERLRVSPAGHCNHVVPHESAGLVRFQSIARSRAPPLALRRNHRSLVNLNVGPATPLRYAIWNPGLSRVCIRPASTAIASGLVQTLTGT